MINKSHPSFQTDTSWIENLALEEINMEQSGTINFDSHQQKTVLLEEESIEFMDKLRDLFEVSMVKFNELRTQAGDNSKTIKIFKISNTVNDFMLFRNSLKLIVARKSADCISIGFLTNTGSFFSARTNQSRHQSNNLDSNKIHEIRAHMGPFNNITWQFQGEPVGPEELCKFYLSEFIRLSSR